MILLVSLSTPGSGCSGVLDQLFLLGYLVVEQLLVYLLSCLGCSVLVEPAVCVAGLLDKLLLFCFPSVFKSIPAFLEVELLMA